MAESVRLGLVNHYRCHECGNGLVNNVSGRYPLWCDRCQKNRQVPTHPALIVRAGVASR